MTMATKTTRKRTATTILQLRIELRGTKPKIWRRVLVPQTITLRKLHSVIRAAFGWSGGHLHEFIAGDGERFGSPDPMYDDAEAVSSDNVRLTTVLRSSTLSYVYDFGDYWEHRIKVEKTHAPDPQLQLPFCVGEQAPNTRDGFAGGHRSTDVGRARSGSRSIGSAHCRALPRDRERAEDLRSTMPRGRL